MNKFEVFVNQLEEIEEIKKGFHKLDGSYQASLKLEVAKSLGLSFDEVNLPYDEWAAIRDPWLSSHGRVN